MSAVAFRAALATCLFPIGSAQAQTSVVPAEPTCESCRVTLTPVVSIGSSDDPAGFDILPKIVATSAPQYFVSSTTFIGELFAYDAAGRFLRSIGRRGEGPGEFNSLLMLRTGPGDSIHAVETRTSRHHVLTPAGRFVRTRQLTGRIIDYVVEPDGRIFASSPASSAAGTDALQVYDTAGRSALRFDRLDADAAATSSGFRRWVALGPDGRRWSSAVDRFEISEWNADGSLRRRLTGERPWLSGEPIPMRLNILQEPPPAQVGGIMFASTGHLLVFTMVADANWRASEELPPFNRIYDTIVEAIDVATGRVHARTRFDEMLMPVGGGLLHATEQTALGDNRLHIRRVSVEASPGRRR